MDSQILAESTLCDIAIIARTEPDPNWDGAWGKGLLEPSVHFGSKEITHVYDLLLGLTEPLTTTDLNALVAVLGILTECGQVICEEPGAQQFLSRWGVEVQDHLPAISDSTISWWSVAESDGELLLVKSMICTTPLQYSVSIVRRF